MSRSWKTGVCAVIGGLTLAACGGGAQGGAGAGASGSSSVEIAVLADLTGGAAFCGKVVKTAAQAAAEKVNKENLLGTTQLELEIYDTATDPRQASKVMSDIASSDAVATVFGCSSAVALAVAPIAQDEQIPFVAMQAGTDGVVQTGNYIFRTTAPQATYADQQVEYWADQGVSSVAIVTQSNNPTLIELGDEVYPKLLADAGIDVVANEHFAGDGFDFSSLASKVVGTNPDAVLVLGQGAPNATIITQLLQSGFDGLIGGSNGFSGGVLEPVGPGANGATWVTDFHPNSDAKSTQQFVQDYKKYAGVNEPNNFAAETWDAMMFTVAGLKAAGEPTREALRDGLQTVCDNGFDGAVGRIEFEGRDARIDGLLVEWRDGGVHIVE